MFDLEYPETEIDALDFKAVKDFNNTMLAKKIDDVMTREITDPNVSDYFDVINLLLRQHSFLYSQLNKYDNMLEPVLSRINENKRNLRVGDVNQVIKNFRYRIDEDMRFQQDFKKHLED